MKRQPRLTKKERKALAGPRPEAAHAHGHIHCVACGRHLEPEELVGAEPTAVVLTCQHGGKFAACHPCADLGQRLLDEHDRTGEPVKQAQAWH